MEALRKTHRHMGKQTRLDSNSKAQIQVQFHNIFLNTWPSKLSLKLFFSLLMTLGLIMTRHTSVRNMLIIICYIIII